MRFVTRTGLLIGSVGIVALSLLALRAALVALPGIIVLGLVSGLCVAKWLPWNWYGRQLEAGARVAGLAVGAASAATLLALLLHAPHDTALLAQRSHLAGITLAPVAHTLSFAGWVGADVLGVLLAAVVAVVLASVTAVVLGASKSTRTVTVVSRAREVADALNHTESWETAGPSTKPAFASLTPARATWTGAPAVTPLQSAGATSGGPTPVATPWRTAATPVTAASPQAPVAMPKPKLPTGYPPDADKPHPPAPDLTPATPPSVTRTPSDARPLDHHLSDAMRDALATWADESRLQQAAKSRDLAPTPAESDAAKDEERTSAHSAFLNSEDRIAAPKRGRKKQNTRDWLC